MHLRNSLKCKITDSSCSRQFSLQRTFVFKFVCDLNNRECKLHNCDLCPGVEKLGDIKDIFTEADVDDDDDDDIVYFKQWMVKDNFRNLFALQLPLQKIMKSVINLET